MEAIIYVIFIGYMDIKARLQNPYLRVIDSFGRERNLPNSFYIQCNITLPKRNGNKSNELQKSAIIAKRTINLHLLDQNDNHLPVQKGNIFFSLRRKDYRKVRIILQRNGICTVFLTNSAYCSGWPNCLLKRINSLVPLSNISNTPMKSYCANH